MDDGVRFCDAAAEAGVDVDLDRGRRDAHVWHIIAVAPEATAASDRLGTFLAGHLRLKEGRPARRRSLIGARPSVAVGVGLVGPSTGTPM